MKVFKLFGGNVVGDLKSYVKNYVSEHPEVEVYVGSDSSQLRRQTVYATVVMFYHPGKGAHVIFNRERIDKVKVLYERLWKEVEDSISVAEIVDEAITEVKGAVPGKRYVTVDLDFNPSALHKSNVVHDAGVGTVKGYGFIARTKPNAWAASYSADLVAR